jgi:hypothetical protein
VFDAVENRHRDHILDMSLAPARVPEGVAAAARGHAARVAAALGLVGVLALEMFLLPDGALLGNEIAPRPHNSGHWTLDACLASQFEQHVRAVAGLPLADPARHHDAVMRNLVGPAGLALARSSGRALAAHLYGKAEGGPAASSATPRGCSPGAWRFAERRFAASCDALPRPPWLLRNMAQWSGRLRARRLVIASPTTRHRIRPISRLAGAASESGIEEGEDELKRPFWPRRCWRCRWPRRRRSP